MNKYNWIYLHFGALQTRTKIAATQKAFVWLFVGTWQTMENVFTLVWCFCFSPLSGAHAVRNAVVVVACSNIRWRVVVGRVGSHCSNKKWVIIKIICTFICSKCAERVYFRIEHVFCLMVFVLSNEFGGLQMRNRRARVLPNALFPCTYRSIYIIYIGLQMDNVALLPSTSRCC